MALYSTVTLTDAGAQLLASLLLSGSPLNLTALAIGSGALEDGDNPQTLTALKEEVKRLPLETINATAGAVVVTASLSTATVTADFTQREIGLYSGDTLIAYGNAGDKADYIPAAGTNTAVTKKFALRLATGNVPVQYQPLDSSEFVTQTQLNETLPTLISSALNQFISGGGSIEASVQPATSSQAGTVLLAEDQTSHRLAAVATSGSYTDLAGVPELRQLKMLSNTGDTLLTIRGNVTNTTFEGEEVSYATSIFTLRSFAACQYYTDSMTGLTRAFFGFTMSPYQLLPYGISEPCAFVGDPSLPLFIRGSRIVISGDDFTPSSMASKTELTAAIDNALWDSETSTMDTATGTSNAIVQYIELDPQHVPVGELVSIALFIRPDRVPTTQAFLGIFEEENDGNYIKIGVSSNAVTQLASTYATWTFPGGINLTGKKIRLIALGSQDADWVPDLQIGLRASARQSGDTSKMFSGATTVNYVPQMQITVARKTEIFAPYAHLNDNVCHLSGAERAQLAPLLERASELLALLDTTSND